MSIEALTRAFMQAGAALGEAFTAEIQKRDPELAAKVARAVASGDCLQLSIAFDQVRPVIRLDTVDTAGNVRQVMHVGAVMSGQRH